MSTQPNADLNRLLTTPAVEASIGRAITTTAKAKRGTQRFRELFSDVIDRLTDKAADFIAHPNPAGYAYVVAQNVCKETVQEWEERRNRELPGDALVSSDTAQAFRQHGINVQVAAEELAQLWDAADVDPAYEHMREGADVEDTFLDLLELEGEWRPVWARFRLEYPADATFAEWYVANKHKAAAITAEDHKRFRNIKARCHRLLAKWWKTDAA